MTRLLLSFAAVSVAAGFAVADGRSVAGRVDTPPEVRPAPVRAAVPPRAVDCNRGAGAWTAGEVKCAIIRVFPAASERGALRVAWCESRYRARAVNSSSGAAGVFQFIPSTWAGRWNPYRRLSPLNPVYNTKAARVLHMQAGWSHWSCRP